MGELKREINLLGLTMIAVGACIGSGIFIVPADSVSHLPHSGWILIVWALGGLTTLLGALTFAELGSRFPNAGGVYIYIREAFGPLLAFLYGWVILLIVNTGAMAALGMALVSFLEFLFPVPASWKSPIVIVIIFGLTIMNIFGVKTSQYFASIFTGLKLASIAFIVMAAVFIGKQGGNNEVILNPLVNIPEGLVSAALLVFVGVFWSCGGWYHATYLSAETKNPRVTVPRALILGTLIVTGTYLVIIYAFMLLVPLQEMALSERIAGDALAQVFTWGGPLVSLFIVISIFGTMGIYTMSAPRIYFAMAKDEVFFPQLAKLHPRYQTPYIAMLFQAVWASLLVIFWGSFIQIITFVTFMDIVFLALGTATIFVIRKQQNNETPFLLKAYPLIPSLFLIISIVFVINTAIHLPQESFTGIFLLLAGIPTFYYFKRRKG